MIEPSRFAIGMVFEEGEPVSATDEFVGYRGRIWGEISVTFGEILTVIALLVGPCMAVGITFWYQDRKQRQDAKERLFFILMMHRNSSPIRQEWVDALNLVDVVFADSPKVIQAWHNLYDYTHSKPMDPRLTANRILEFLSQISRSIGYKTLRDSDIERFYSPEGAQGVSKAQAEVQAEFLRVLRASGAFSHPPRTPSE